MGDSGPRRPPFPRIPLSADHQTSKGGTRPDRPNLDTGDDSASGPPTVRAEHWIPNTSSQKTKHRGSGWKGLEEAMQALCLTTKAIPPVHSAVGALVSCLEQFEVADRNQEGYNEVVSELSAMAEYLEWHLKEPRSHGLIEKISDVANTIQMEIDEVRKLQGQSKTQQLLRATDIEEDLSRRFRRIGELFRRIQMETSMSEWSNVHESQVNTRLEKLEPSRLARYNSGLSDTIGRRSCTEDTRLDILAEIDMWCDNPKSPMIYWMDGMAGTGKTTIAYTLAKRLESCHRLGASFFCTVTSEECRKAGKIIPTIAYQLSQQSTPFKAALGAVLKDDPDAPVLSIPEQMKRLLADPLNGVKDSMARNLIVVIDALDECYDGNVVRLILSSLVSSAGQLPLKFFITSRPEPAIFDQMSTRPDNIRSVLRLHEVSQDAVQRDIKTYLKDGLQSISPSEDELDRLTMLSERLFIYAATAVRYIIPENASVNSHARMKTMLDINSKSTKRYSGIDTLYSAILSGAINNDDLEPDERDSILSVVWSIVCSDHPVSLSGLVVIAGLGCETAALAALAPLRSVLHVSPTNDTISSFHASFPQFILDQSRSKSYSCNPPHIRQSSAIRCLKVIHAQLPGKIQPDMVMSPHLAYASENWIPHLVRGSCGADEVLGELYTELRRFFEERFESWIWLIHDRLKAQPSHYPAITNSQSTKPALGARYRVRYRTRVNQSLIERLGRWLQRINGPADLRQASRNAADYIAFSKENRKLIRDEALQNHPLVNRGSTGASYRSWIWGKVDYSKINFHFPES